MKKKVIAYVHTHWDREWYREFEVFRLRLLRIFDNVLEMLENGALPCFYFDGQVAALLDYLEIRPEKEALVRRFIKEKKLFIGPFYCLVDEFLTDKTAFEKNLEIGLKISKDFGCEDFIGYLADTFGHSANVCSAFKKFEINKCMVWRGCGDLPSEFIFNGLNTINMVRGYFMDIFSTLLSADKKAEFLKDNLDKIAEKSSDILLLPIGADHLGVVKNLKEQIKSINNLLEDYEIVLSSPFEYFDAVSNNFKKEFNSELRDNSKTFILQGCYSARTKLKQYNVQCSYLLKSADNIQKYYGNKYSSIIEYAYKLLLQNQAHDSICGCSTDLVHRENIIRYEKIIQIAKTIIKEIKFENSLKSPDFEYKLAEILRADIPVIEFESLDKNDGEQIVSVRKGFDDEILYDTLKIPVTEDYTEIFRFIKSDLNGDFKFSPALKDDKLLIGNGVCVDFIRYNDNGDTYNFGPEKKDCGEISEIKNLELLIDGPLRREWILKTSFFDVKIISDINSDILKFKIEWINELKNKIWQVRFNLNSPVSNTISEDMDTLIVREFEPSYNIRENLPEKRGIEAKTNTAPMQRFVSAQGLNIITKGLTEYEVCGNYLQVTLLRSVGIISNPKNSSRTTPAGPPLEVPGAQQFGINTAEFAIGFFNPDDYQKYIDEYYFPDIL